MRRVLRRRVITHFITQKPEPFLRQCSVTKKRDGVFEELKMA